MSSANTIATEDEVRAAIAEVAALEPGAAEDQIPSLDDGSGFVVVPVPLPPMMTPGDVAPTPTPATAPGAADLPGAAEPAGAAPAVGGDSLASVDGAPAPAGEGAPVALAAAASEATAAPHVAPPDGSAPAAVPAPVAAGDAAAAPTAAGDEIAASPPAAARRWSPLVLLVRVADVLLNAANWPFRGLSPGQRQAIGVFAVLSIAGSRSFPNVLPHVVRRETALTFLADRAAAARCPPAAAQPADAKPKDGAAGAKPKAESAKSGHAPEKPASAEAAKPKKH